jgi:hypothetical protein
LKSCLAIFPVLFLVLAGCVRKNVPVPAEVYGQDYYPVLQGHYIVYDADSTVYTDISRDTVHYRFRLKEKNAGSFIDSEGAVAHRIERYVKVYDPRRDYDSIPWRLREVWMMNADGDRVQVVEGNKRYTKLVFPVREYKTWNGNAQNADGEQLYTYEYIDRAESIGITTLSRVLKVKQKEFRTLISFEGASEKYAAAVGLVAIESAEYYSNTVVPGVPVEKRIEHGYIYTQYLVTHGSE